jgi:hypothetical protein
MAQLQNPGVLHHVILPTFGQLPVVLDGEDWRALGVSVANMLFWCGGRVFACRGEGAELHFALETAGASVGCMCRRIAVRYALYLVKRRATRGRIFRPYLALPLPSAYRQDLVLWLHRHTGNACCTTDAAYLTPGSTSWVDTNAVLGELGRGEYAIAEYLRLRRRGVGALTAAEFGTGPGRRRASRVSGPIGSETPRKDRGGSEMIIRIARQVGEHESVSYEEMRGSSCKRDVSRARYLASVIAVRSGASIAEVGRILHRDPATLMEGAETLNLREPGVFDRVGWAIGSQIPEDNGQEAVRLAQS